MSESSSTATGQHSRWAKYGLNVGVATAAALTLLILVNWIAYRQFIRFDLTATRQYSLSDQTRTVLNELDAGEYQLVTLFTGSGPYVEQARDLTDEYARYGDNLTVEHIDPGRELGRLERFFDALHSRYESELEPIASTISKARQLMDQVRAATSEMGPSLRTVLEDQSLPDGELKMFIREVAQAFARFDAQIQAISRQLQADLNQPLPNYKQARQTLKVLMSDLDEKVFTLTVQHFEQAAARQDTPNPVKNGLLALNARLKSLLGEIRRTAASLESVAEVEAYDQISDQLANPDPLIVSGPNQVRVIGIGELFREPDPQQVEPGRQPQLRFQGEEKITGALLSMSLDDQPLVVFISTGESVALGARGAYEQVAQRLRTMNFDVQEWNPSGRVGPMSQPLPPQPQPEPKSGQRAVWIVPPIAPPNPANPLDAGAGQRVAQILNTRLESGDGVLVLMTVAPMARFGAPNPIGALAEDWGIKPLLDTLVLRRVTLPDNRTQSTTQLDIVNWSDDLVITKALSGMPGIFLQASPLELDASDTGTAQTWPMVELEGQDFWAEQDLTGTAPPEYDAESAGGPFVLAAASERDGQRLIVVADPSWATDQIISYGPLGPGTAEIFGATFPANSELFVNSVLWLSRLDQLIAASPRTQDIRRIEPISRGGMAALRWALLAGMPAVAAAAGLMVWSFRRNV